MTFGQRMRYYRQKINASQADIELKTGIPQTTLSRWENDSAEPRITELILLATAYGVTIAELLSDSNQQSTALPRTG